VSAAELYIDLVERGFRLRADDNDRLIVSPGNQLKDADRAAIRRHKAELMGMVSIAGNAQDDEAIDETTPAATRTVHPIPSRCLSPTACAVLGVCGREACVSPGEFGEFAAAMATARRPTNPHIVPEFYAPGQEVDHAA